MLSESHNVDSIGICWHLLFTYRSAVSSNVDNRSGS